MKKISAFLITSAAAVTMFAFAGCGGSPTATEGEIPGDYKEKTPEQAAEIIENIDTDKLFGDIEDENTALNIGTRANIAVTCTMGDLANLSYSAEMEYKTSSTADSTAGVGSLKLNGSYSGVDFETGETASGEPLNFSGNVYNDDEWVYAVSGENKLKINMQELTEIIGEFGGDFVSPASFYEAESSLNVATLLTLAKDYAITVAIDETDGIKIKLSASEETVWKVVAVAGEEEGITEEMIAQVKQLVTFNTFKFDVYFSIDGDGKFSAASIVMDIDVTADGSLLTMFMGMAADGDTASQQMPSITATYKGFIEIYTHNDTVTVPDTVKSDSAYVDMTDVILGKIGDIGDMM